MLFSFNFSAYDFCDDCRYFNVFFGVNKMEKFKLKSMRERELIEKVEILERENAVENFRTLIGATNPANAAEGTIRKLYAISMGENAIHGSDSDENAQIEGNFHFSGREQF